MNTETLSPPIGMQATGKHLNVSLLFLAILIVAADKTVFAFAGHYIMDEFELSANQFGLVGGAFFFLYSLSGVGIGLLTNRFAARWILLALALIWTFCQAGIALSTGLFALVLFRMLLGVGAGPSTAIVQFACSKWFAPDKRVVPASAISAALMGGVLIAAVTLPPIISHWGWRTAYLMLGGLSAIWAVVWILFGREGEAPGEAHATPVETADHAGAQAWVPYRRLLVNPTFIGMTGLTFCSFLASGLGLSWTPTYLQKSLGFSASHMGLITMGIMACVIPVMILVSRFSQRLLKKGVPYFMAVVVPPLVCTVVGSLANIFMLDGSMSAGLKVAVLGLGFVMLNVPQSFGIIVCGEISTERQRGSVISIHVALTTLAGVVAPILAGWMITQANEQLGLGYERTLAVVGAMNLIAALICLWMVRPEKTRKSLHASGA